MLKSQKLFCAAAVAVMLGAAASLPAAAAYEYDEPRNETERIALIDRLIVEKEYRDALKQIDLALKANSRNVQLQFKRAVIYSRMGNNRRAKNAFNDLIARYPEIVEPYNNLAAIYASEGNLTKAKEWLNKAITVNPNFAMSYENLADLELQSKNPDVNAALANYEKALALAPEDRVLARKVRTFKKYLEEQRKNK